MTKSDARNKEEMKSVSFMIRMPNYRLKEIDAEAVIRLYSRSGLMREAADVLLKIPREEFFLLKRYAYKAGVRLSRLVQEAIEQYVARKRQEMERSLETLPGGVKVKIRERKEA